MKTHDTPGLAFSLMAAMALMGCNGQGSTNATGSVAAQAAPEVPLDPKNIVSIAVGSKDHTTLVAALKAADYVTAVSNPGPLTVFAPTNAAFDKVPKDTLEGLMKPDKQGDLREVLKYHVTTSTWEAPSLRDGMQLGMANGAKATIHVQGDKIMINDATVIASIRCSNGVIHVIDTVLMPPAK